MVKVNLFYTVLAVRRREAKYVVILNNVHASHSVFVLCPVHRCLKSVIWIPMKLGMLIDNFSLGLVNINPVSRKGSN